MNKIFIVKKKYISIFLFMIIISLYLISCSSLYKNSNYIKPDPNQMIVHFIDIGQGDSILIQVNNKNMLIDAGPKSDKNELLNYLSKLNIEKLDYVIATHPHEDHIGNMSDIIDSYNVLKFYAPKVQSTTKTFEKMIDSLKRKGLKINVIRKDTDSIDLGKNTNVRVFSPIDDSYENLNNYSSVIRIQYGSTYFLFTGDAEKDVEEKILDNNENISSDVLKVGHHGSSTSTSKAFLNKINPSIGVISVGKDNTYNHPNNETIKSLKENKVTIYRTDKDGTVILSSDGTKISKK
ncbi:ComEC/Rec2 family competence protein [Clostridium chromiireducens]|uniref:Hydroxyacylglutathione hydrolase n=1 Tax=Clostridium chromiireducens TaxID=225345 RepID=A0A1V4IZ07_9CLOT|nr:ComEC/Rec2 family competence protein [Clostridium chromiireducens]OPJ65292.1 hydroxyacylglutathione hydrolase [Clostridium chromiireducens]